MRSAKYKFTSIVNSKGAKCEVRNWTKSLLDKTVPGHFRFGQKILDIFVVTLNSKQPRDEQSLPGLHFIQGSGPNMADIL